MDPSPLLKASPAPMAQTDGISDAVAASPFQQADPAPSSQINALGYRESTRLRKGLQVPTRGSMVTTGFKLPPTLMKAGITKDQWKLFSHEIKKGAELDGKQVTLVLGGSFGWMILGVMFSPVLFWTLGAVVEYQYGKEKQMENFTQSYNNGVLQTCCQKWNLKYFEALSLHAHVEMPNYGRMEDTDVSNTKLFKFREKHGVVAGADGSVVDNGNPVMGTRESKYYNKETRGKAKAARKVRIVILPLNMVPQQEHTLPSIESYEQPTTQSYGIVEDTDQPGAVDPAPSYFRVRNDPKNPSPPAYDVPGLPNGRK